MEGYNGINITRREEDNIRLMIYKVLIYWSNYVIYNVVALICGGVDSMEGVSVLPHEKMDR